MRPAALCLFLAACGEGEAPASGPITPTEGTWTRTVLAVPDDGCGSGDQMLEDPEDEVALALVEGGFTLGVVGGQTILWTCALDHGAFTCEDDIEQIPVGSTTVLVTQSYGGSFQSEATAEASAGFDFACESEDCTSAAEQIGIPIPCSSTAAVSLAFVE